MSLLLELNFPSILNRPANYKKTSATYTEEIRMPTELYYEVHGEGRPVVFAHGMGGNHASWFQQVPVFAQHHMVVTFDHRGFGNSREVEGGADRSRFVGDLKDLLD